jgi:hypothetical protein
VGLIDDSLGLGEGDLKCTERERVGGAKISAGDLEKRVECELVERYRFGSRHPAAVRDVLVRLIAGEVSEGGDVRETTSDVLEVLAPKTRPKRRLPSEHDADDEPAIHLEVGEDPKNAEDVGP